MRRRHEVWSEGHSATGERSYARLHGTVIARSFKEACNELLGDKEDYNEEDLTYWGCRLYNNEKSARKHFG